jgi:hypothetical protein
LSVPDRNGISSGVGKLFPVIKSSNPNNKAAAQPLTPLYLRTLIYDSNVDAAVPSFSVKLRVMLIYKAHDNTIDSSLLSELSKVGRLKLKDATQKQLLTDSVKPELPGHGNGSSEQVVTFYNSSEVNVWDELDIYLLQSGGPSSPTYVCMEIGYNVTFHLHLALHNFPFDYHQPELQIMLKFEDCTNFEMQLFFVEIHSACTKMEEFSILTPSCLQVSARQTNLQLNLGRRPLFWLHSIVFLSASMQFLMLLVFLVPSGDVADRLGVSFTLILTMVAFRTYIVSTEPKAEYLTLMDNYINAGTIGTIGICIGSSISSEYGDDFDKIMFYSSLGGIVLIHCYFAKVAWVLNTLMPDELKVEDGKWGSFQFGASLEEQLAEEKVTWEMAKEKKVEKKVEEKVEDDKKVRNQSSIWSKKAKQQVGVQSEIANPALDVTSVEVAGGLLR